jgi:uncharacterized protein HemX
MSMDRIRLSLNGVVQSDGCEIREVNDPSSYAANNVTESESTMKLKTVFILLAVLALCVVGVGFYQGWWVMSTHRDTDGSNKVDVNLTVNPDKAKADAEAVKAKAGNLTGKSAETTPAKTSDGGVKSKVE